MARKESHLDRLGHVPLFSACTDRELRMVARQAETITFAAGDILVKQGARGREVFVMVDGKVEVSRDGDTVAVLGPGDYFGELAILDPAPRDASVLATTSGEALILDQRALFGLLAELPHFSRKVMVGMARRLHEADNRPVR